MKPIATSRIQKNNVVVIVISAVSLSLGVALLANFITEFLGANYVLATFGVILIVASLYFIAKIINPTVNRVLRIQGGFFFEPSTLKGKGVIGYEFNNDMATYLRAIGVENKAYSRALINNYNNYDRKRGNYDPDNLDFYDLAASCAEFLFLKELSMHLNSYFVHEEIDKSLIMSIPRNELSKDILRNRVLELITRNHQEREAFCDDHDSDGDSILCYAEGENGEVFSHLELELPFGTTLNRSSDNSLKIENSVFEIRYVVRCDATNTVIARELIQGKYGVPWLVATKLEVTVKKHTFLKSNDILLYQWLDSFLTKFDRYMSISKLHERSSLQLVKILKP